MRVVIERQKNDKSDNNNNEECTGLGVCECYECYSSCVWKNMKVIEIIMCNNGSCVWKNMKVVEIIMCNK